MTETRLRFGHWPVGKWTDIFGSGGEIPNHKFQINSKHQYSMTEMEDWLCHWSVGKWTDIFGSGGEIPNLKKQIPNKFEEPILNDQNESSFWSLAFRIWCLPGRRQAGLRFGTWYLEFPQVGKVVSRKGPDVYSPDPDSIVWAQWRRKN